MIPYRAPLKVALAAAVLSAANACTKPSGMTGERPAEAQAAMAGPVMMPLATALIAEVPPDRPAIFTLSSDRWRGLVSDLPADPGPYPADCAFLVAVRMPTLAFRDGRFHLTPIDEYAITKPCFSEDPNVACVPRYRFDPMRGMVMLGCECFQVGVRAGPAPTVRIGGDLRRTGCELAISDSAVTCQGRCPADGDACRIGASETEAGWLVTCRCRPDDA